MLVELLSWLPSLYGCLPNRLKSDPDVVAGLLAANPKKYLGWGKLLGRIPVEVQLQHPDLVLRVLKGYEDCGLGRYFDTVYHLSENALVPDLWRNRDVVLALFRCEMSNVPEGVVEHFENDRELWVDVARIEAWNHSAFKKYCPASLRSDPQFMHQAVRANPEICLRCLTGDPPADLDLILAACATSQDFVEIFAYRVEQCFCFDKMFYPELKVYLCREVRDRASRYLSFSFFLSLQPSLHSPLGLLNQGPDTAQAYRSLLANYAGVPSDDKQLGEELIGLKRLSVALARRGL